MRCTVKNVISIRSALQALLLLCSERTGGRTHTYKSPASDKLPRIIMRLGHAFVRRPKSPPLECLSFAARSQRKCTPPSSFTSSTGSVPLVVLLPAGECRENFGFFIMHVLHGVQLWPKSSKHRRRPHTITSATRALGSVGGGSPLCADCKDEAVGNTAVSSTAGAHTPALCTP